jgi:radical SAM protein with 4Fe4S-binding SPASM domain
MNHSVLSDEAYGVFSKNVSDRASQDRLPLSATVEVTMRCNLRCKHCYVPCGQRLAKRANELALGEFSRIFSEFADAGVLWLLLTGGEPLLRADFLDIYDLAKQKGFIITIFTNGTLLNERIADHLAEYRPFSIEISLYGATQETYESITSVSGSFKRCMRGIELLLDRGLPLVLKAPLMTLNAHELDDMKAFSESIGVNFHFDPVISAGTNGDTSPLSYRLPAEEIVQYELQDERRAATWPEKIASYEGKKITGRNMYTCGAGRTGFHMDAFGKISLCISARDPNYDMRTGNFKEAWDDFIPKILSLAYSPGFECLDCPLRMICSQCPAMGLTELGKVDAVVPFLCQLAHLRSEVFIK